MNAITEAPVARQSLTSQTGFATIDIENAAPERTRPTMAWQGKSTARQVIPPPVGSCASTQPCHRQPRRAQAQGSAARIKHMPRGLIIARGMRATSDPTPIERGYYRGLRLLCLASASPIGGDKLCGNLR
jgi:hypothetical protein